MAELVCPGDVEQVQQLQKEFNQSLPAVTRSNSHTNGIVHDVECPTILATTMTTKQELRAAGIEFLFGRASPPLIQEAQRQLALVFQKTAGSRIPENLITVHIRWGAKVVATSKLSAEMKKG
jgi:hypothetical protein